MSNNAYQTVKLSTAKLTSNQTAGAIIWLISAYTTALFIGQIGIREPISYVLGIAVQWLFTKAEQPIWRGKGYPALGVVVTGVDVLFNAVGIWPYIRDQFGNTDLWRMVADLTHDPSPPTLLVRFLIVLVVGIAVAAGPEYFWSRD
jgi:hypothetical protein